MTYKASYLMLGAIFLLSVGAFPHHALAYFGSVPDAVGGTTVSAGTLGFTIDTSATTQSVAAGSSVIVSADITDTGSIDFQYKTAARHLSCDPTVEGDLVLTAMRDGAVVYVGPIAGFTITTDQSSGAWSFGFTLAADSAAAPDAACSFDVEFSAWQHGMPTSAAGGFSAKRTVHVVLTVAPPPTPSPGSSDASVGIAPTVTAVTPATGTPDGGESVTITGSGFTGATNVFFGATAATGVTVASDSSITVTSPPGSGTVDVTVTTPLGTSVVGAADQFSYQSPPTNPN